MKRIFAAIALLSVAALALANPPPKALELADINVRPIVVAPLALAAVDEPNTPWSASFYFDIRGGTGNAVVMTRICPLTANGKPTRFNLDGFLGASISDETKPVAGMAVTRQWTLFDQVFFHAGLGISIAGGSPVGGGVILGAGIRF